jgi:hypothetical protein
MGSTSGRALGSMESAEITGKEIPGVWLTWITSKISAFNNSGAYSNTRDYISPTFRLGHEPECTAPTPMTSLTVVEKALSSGCWPRTRKPFRFEKGGDEG